MIKAAHFTLGCGILLISAGWACQTQVTHRSDNNEPQPQNAVVIKTVEGLALDKVPYEKGQLIVQGSPIPITLKSTVDGQKVTLSLVGPDEEFDAEIYELKPEGVFFIGTRTDTFEPPIQLLRLPFETKDTWQWQGRTKVGPTEREATATITCTSEPLNVVGASVEAAVTSIDLVIKMDQAPPAKRLLKFWFAPNRGVLRRELGGINTRESAP